MKWLRLVSLFVFLSFASNSTVWGQESSVQSIRVGYSNLFRPGEWTPIEIKLSSATQIDTVTVRVEDSISYEIKSQSGSTFRSWIVLPKFSANRIDILDGDKLLYSSTRNEQLHLEPVAIHAEFRLVLAFFQGGVSLERFREEFHRNSIHLGTLKRWQIGPHSLLESVDRIITHGTAIQAINKSELKELRLWQKGHGRLDNIDKSKSNSNPLRFAQYIINAEALRDVQHKNFAIDSHIYKVFGGSTIPSESIRNAAFYSLPMGGVFLLALAFLPVRRRKIFVAIWILVGCGMATGAYFASESLAMTVQESADIIQLREKGTADHFQWINCSTHFHNESIQLGDPGDPFKAVYFSSGDPAYINYFDKGTGAGPQHGSFQLPKRLWPAFLLRKQFKSKGKLSVTVHNKVASVGNYTGELFQSHLLIQYDKVYLLGTLKDGEESSTELIKVIDLMELEYELPELSNSQIELLFYWLDHLAIAGHDYWVGIAASKDSNGFLSKGRLFYQRIFE